MTAFPNLNSDHEEAYTKLAALVRAANVSSGKSINVRFPSGDTDILILFVAHDFRDSNVFIDNGKSKSWKTIKVTPSQLSVEEKNHLLEYMPFLEMTVSSFFRKGKSAFGNQL